MTNPLLQPDDRFRRKTVDALGRNRFSDDAAPAEESSAVTSENPLAGPSDSSQRPYLPRYQTSYAHHGPLVIGLGLLGLAGCFALLMAFAGQALIGLALGLLGIALCLAAVVRGYQELSGMANGAVDASGRFLALTGYGFGLMGLVIGFALASYVVVQMIRGLIELG